MAGNAQPSLVNSPTVTGSGARPASSTSTDSTAIVARADLAVTAFASSRGVPYAPFTQGDGGGQHDTCTISVFDAGFAGGRRQTTLRA